MSTPERPPNFITLTKAGVAHSQLESALLLWFAYGDPVSILALAAAAHHCYRALTKQTKEQSAFEQWLKSQPKGRRERIRYSVNWIKHGDMDLKKKPVFMPITGEVYLVDSIECHEHLHGEKTPLMSLFVAKYALELPAVTTAHVAPLILKQLKIYDLPYGDRRQFLNEAIKRLGAR